MGTKYVEAQGKAFLQEAVGLIADGKAEDVLRHALSAKLPLMFPELPWWIKSHVTGSESLAKFHDVGTRKYGFVDVLVGSTVIEYERNLQTLGTYGHGLHQVKQYCASRLNEGTPPDLLVGVLSDTVRWHAFQVSDVKELAAIPGAKMYGPGHFELIEIESCDLSGAGIVEAKKLGAFLVRHLGREGGRQLAASTLAKDMGFDSPFCQAHIDPINKLVESAFARDAVYAGLIAKLWTDFVSYLGGESAAGRFDKTSYVNELYILTLAKLICANVLSSRGLVSDDSELRSILDGAFFKAKALPNLVEYDYFGWLNTSPYVEILVEVARDIQHDLCAYDFKSPPLEDMFGTLMAQLAARSQRLLLGQEWTPAWLAERLVVEALSKISPDQQPRFVDMCCGSGAMIVATVKAAQTRLMASGVKPGDAAALSELTSAITAFDIDPLAVILAKVGWVLASRDWLVAGCEAQIPVYHADSLFANTPVTKAFSATGEEQRTLSLDTEEVDLPQFLIESNKQTLFDALLSRGYEMAMSSAAAAKTTLEDHDIEVMVDSVTEDSNSSLTADERAAALHFVGRLLRALEALQRAGRNGIWAFVLRNSFRPALVAGRFNGIVTNPPWLALSRIGSNPYRNALKSKADQYRIKAPGASHLHLEIATIFLLHAIDRYLIPEAVVACVLPDTVLNGSHHEPFRLARYLSASRPVAFDPQAIWKVASQTFKNEAIVLLGRKRQPKLSPAKFLGREVGRFHDVNIEFQVVASGGKTAWTATPSGTASVKVEIAESVGPLFRQGADVMPRGIIFHYAEKAGQSWNLGPVTPGSPSYFLRSEGKVLANFSLNVSGVSDQVMFDVLISKHLAPWELAVGSKALLPFRWGVSGWEAHSRSGVAALGVSTACALTAALAAVNETIDGFFARVDSDRKKLTKQFWSDEVYLVVASAGGKLPCAAYIRGNQVPCSRTILDQTLYWGRVASEDEAIYITALINSPAVIDVIKQHQPRGAFGERHIHKLAFDRTPIFDRASTKHIAVVNAAKALLAEWSVRRIQTDISPSLKPEAHMITRRKRIRLALESLPSWATYVAATRAVYED
jgi:methylase of polypeptide subunit release factors